MTAQGWLQIAIFLAVLTALTPLLGAYMARVYRGERLALEPLLGPLERMIYRLIGSSAREGQDWKAYARTTIVFSLVFWLLLYGILRTQGVHPFNPEGFHAGPWDLSFNTASSFVTNTSWQYYGGETTLSNFSQMTGITVQMFVSGAVGMAVLAAVIRGIASRGSSELGNFWRDVTRTLLYILLPLSFVAAVFLVSQGVIQTLSGFPAYDTLDGGQQTLAVGPVASLEPIKIMAGDGGGFFNVNSAMPFENPTQLSNFVELLFLLLIPASLTATFGRMVGSRRQGWALFAAMMIMLAVGIGVTYGAEQHGSPAEHVAGLHTEAADGTTGGNMEGKEQRFGISASSTWTAAATAGGDGAVNSALDSYTGIGAIVPLTNMMTSEVVFGGPGSGLYGMLLLVLLSVFIAGLMVGRTPEYLGKKIESREVKLVMISVLVVPIGVLVGTALAISSKWGGPSIFNPGPQGFAESLYAYTSQTVNNGSAFAGYTGFVQPNAPGNAGAYGITFADIVGGLAMLFGRYVPMLAALGVAGSLATKRISPAGPGTLRTDTPTFVYLLIFVVIVVAALTFFPALLLGPFVQGLTNQLF